jgi:hypothetical protein
VMDVRRQVFGSADPPFTSRADRACQRWEAERLDRRPTRADRALDEAVERLANATGFKSLDVYMWILTGARPPHLPRAVISVQAVRDVLPDGANIRRKWATITINAPITKNEILKVWRRLNAGWTDPAAGPDFETLASGKGARRGRTPRLTDLDLAALRLVEAMPDATWDERAEAWEHGPIQANTLHQRYRRAAHKRARLNASPAEQED